MKIGCRPPRLCATIAQPGHKTQRKKPPEGLESPRGEAPEAGAWKAATNAAMPKFQKLPDPWLYDTGALIGDLDCVKELILRIPVHNNTVLPTNAAISAVWDLRERIRELAVLRLKSQRHWKSKHEEKRGPKLPTPAAATRRKTARKVAAIRGA